MIMANDFKYDVFLSHSSKDKAVVRPLAERLRNDKLSVWFDEWEIPPDDSLSPRERERVRAAKIEEGLELSRVLVLCMSANAFGSDWATMESQTFRFRDPLNKERHFIPLRLDDAPIKGSLAQFLYINWLPADREQEYAKLHEACRPPAKPLEAEAEATRKLIAEKVIQLDYKDARIHAYAFSLDGKRVLTGGSDNTVRLWDMETGRCLSVFEGHGSNVFGVAWTVKHFLSGAFLDNIIRLWDSETGRCLRALKGHMNGVWTVAWATDQRHALSGSADKTIRLWDMKTGRCLCVLEGHTEDVLCVTWSTDLCYALSSSADKTVRLWNVKTGQCLRVFEGHIAMVWSVAWSPDGKRALSGAEDNTVRLWEVETGRCLRVLEGHTARILSVAITSDSRFALSGSDDKSVRLWDMETGHCLAVLGHRTEIKSVALSADGIHAFSSDSSGGIRVWNLSAFITEVRTPKVHAPDQVQYMNAKVLLVGDTGVGKSGLAERLVHKQFMPTKSSHARKAHVLESKIMKAPGNVSLNQETVLWDLAGQPAYRLVHQLSMEDAALACVLFDSRSETNPFEGAAYWSQVLDQAYTNAKIKKLLVASRIDVGGLPASRERIESFASEQGFAKFIPTSANTGEGCDALL
jgi:small GTP-binding protein